MVFRIRKMWGDELVTFENIFVLLLKYRCECFPGIPVKTSLKPLKVNSL